MYYNLCITIRIIYAVTATVFETDVSNRRMSGQMVVHHFVIDRLMQSLEATGIVDERPRSGRPHKTKRKDDRRIFRCAMRARFGGHISVRNVNRRLNEQRLAIHKTVIKSLTGSMELLTLPSPLEYS